MDTFTEDLKGPSRKHTHSIASEMEGSLYQRLPYSSNDGIPRPKRKEVAGESGVQRSTTLSSRGTFLNRTLTSALDKKDHKTSSEDPWGKLSNDMIEYILARLPLFPLKNSKKVCKRWEAVINTPEFEILHKKLGEPQPWFVCYGMNYLVSSKSQAFAFDDESAEWIILPPLHFPSHNFGSIAGCNGLVTAIAGPGENRLKYKLTNSWAPSSSFEDMWNETPLMRFPRSAPIVSVAHRTGRGGTAHKVVVAGGVPDFEPEHMAVEVFDSETGAWELHEDLPAEFSGSSSKSWMSGDVCDGKFYVSLIYSWSVSALDLSTKVWSSVHWDRPPGLVYHHLLSIGATILVAGLCRDSELSMENTVKVWKVNLKTQNLIEIGTMPKHLFTALEKNYEGVPNLNFLVNENMLYTYKSNVQDRAVVVGEFSLEDCEMEWRTLPSLPTIGYRFDNMVAFCTSMSIGS